MLRWQPDIDQDRPREAQAEVDQDRQPAKEPFALLEAKREEILATWIDLIEQLPAFQVMERPVPDLRALSALGLDAVVDSLSTGSYATLESFLTSTYNTYLSADADVADAIDALFMLKESTMGMLRQSIACGSASMLDACARMDAFLRHAVSFLARHHAAATNARLRERQERTSTLLEILRAAASTLDLDQVLRQVGSAISSLLGVPHTNFCLVDRDRDLLIVQYTVDEGAIHSSLTSPAMGESLPIVSSFGPFAEDVLERQVSVVCENTSTDPRIAKGWKNEQGIKSFLAIPFVVKEKVVAIAFACTYDEYRTFDDEQIELARGVANAVALTIENARLHREMRGMAIMEERDRLAREMHDNLAQALSALQLKASQVASSLAQGATDPAQSAVYELQEWISEVHTDVREAIFDMRTIVSPDEGFLSALQSYLRAYQTRYGVEVELHAKAASELDLTGDTGFQVMRIIQEAVANVRKHAGTNRAAIQIERNDEQVLIRVGDEGRGFDRAGLGKADRGLGLQVMAERAESIGGALEIESQPGRGTSVVLSFPVSGNRRS